MTDPKNPYFSRATVQRVWALLFGRPLLETVEAMSPDGEYPRALDILAEDFAAHDYDLQRLIRIIAATEVFQQDSAADHEINEEHERALGGLSAGPAAARTGGRKCFSGRLGARPLT